MTQATRPVGKRYRLLREFGFCCAYCTLPIGSAISKRGEHFRITTYHIDHFLPRSYRQVEVDRNLVPSCDLCNLMKSDKFFASYDEAIAYMRERWEQKGYITIWTPSVSSEQDPVQWAREFAHFLSTATVR